MKMPAVVCLLICFLSSPVPTRAQELTDLHDMEIVVEDLHAEPAKALGITKESLRDEVLVALKRDIPKMRVEKSSHNWVI